jgi:uncharacterized protein
MKRSILACLVLILLLSQAQSAVLSCFSDFDKKTRCLPVSISQQKFFLAASAVSTNEKPGNSSIGIGDVLVMIGVGFLIVGGLRMLVAAFKESVVWGIVCIIFSPIFIVMKWSAAKKGFLMQLLFIPFLIVSSFVGIGSKGNFLISMIPGGGTSGSSDAYSAYQKFANAIISGKFDDAKLMARNDSVRSAIEEAQQRHFGLGTIHNASYDKQSEAKSSDGKSVTLKVLQVVNLDPPGVQSGLGRMHVPHEQTVVMIKEGSDWKVDAFKDNLKGEDGASTISSTGGSNNIIKEIGSMMSEEQKLKKKVLAAVEKERGDAPPDTYSPPTQSLGASRPTATSKSSTPAGPIQSGETVENQFQQFESVNSQPANPSAELKSSAPVSEPIVDSSETQEPVLEDVNKADEKGWTPLMYAASQSDWGGLLQLLNKGAKVNVADVNGWTPLMLASYQGGEEIIKLLLTRGANVNATTKRNTTPLIIAAGKGNKGVVKLLLGTPAIDFGIKDADGKTALTYATEKGHTDIMEMLKTAGAKE